MKTVKDIFNIDSDIEVKDIKINSKAVKENDVFVCVSGVNFDRHEFIDEAVNNGASVIVVSKDIKRDDVLVIKVDDCDEEMPKIARKLYDYHEGDFKLFGVTGTDGKTSTAMILSTLIGNDICGYIGTNGYSCSKFHKETNNTTPDADLMYKYFKELKDAGCKYIVMEVSSEASFRKRLRNLYFDALILTNVTRDHLNVHKTIENYIECKKEIFHHLKEDGIAILNKDDKLYEDFKKINKINYSYGKDADLSFKNIEYFDHSTKFDIIYDDKRININSPLIGSFNVYNLSAAILLCEKLNIEYKDNIKNISIPGRVNFIDMGQDYKIVIDYAHTVNAIKNILSLADNFKVNRKIVVTGMAGSRDKGKRPIVGELLSEKADLSILCFDDPADEDPLDIIKEILTGFKNDHFIIEVDRKKAIKKAMEIAKKDDIIFILGKGNEKSHKCITGPIVMNDEEEVRKNLK